MLRYSTDIIYIFGNIHFFSFYLDIMISKMIIIEGAHKNFLSELYHKIRLKAVGLNMCQINAGILTP